MNPIDAAILTTHARIAAETRNETRRPQATVCRKTVAKNSEHERQTMTTPINPTERIKRDQRGVTLERTDGTLVHHLPWELPRLAAELMAQPNLDAGHRELLRIYAMGRPSAEYFPVGAERHNHGDPVCHSRIGYVLPDYEHPGAYYLFPQPRAFDGQPYPEPRWQGDCWWQTVRLPVPAGARILDAQPKCDEPNAVVVRWSKSVKCDGCTQWLKACDSPCVPAKEQPPDHCPKCDSPDPKCDWLPWKADVAKCVESVEELASRCTCGARVFLQHKHGCPGGGESWSK